MYRYGNNVPILPNARIGIPIYLYHVPINRSVYLSYIGTYSGVYNGTYSGVPITNMVRHDPESVHISVYRSVISVHFTNVPMCPAGIPIITFFHIGIPIVSIWYTVFFKNRYTDMFLKIGIPIILFIRCTDVDMGTCIGIPIHRIGTYIGIPKCISVYPRDTISVYQTGVSWLECNLDIQNAT